MATFQITGIVSIDEIKSIVEARDQYFDAEQIYIMPDGNNEKEDFLNEHSPDIYKALSQLGGYPVVLVRQSNYSFIELRSAEIILPLVIGIPFAVFANLLTDWLKEKYINKEINVKIGRKTDAGYEKIEITGPVDDVVKVLNDLK